MKHDSFFIVMALLIYPLTPYIFSRQSCKTGYGGVKAASIIQVELEKANRQEKKISVFFFFKLKHSVSHLQGQLEASPSLIHLVDSMTECKLCFFCVLSICSYWILD